MSTKIVIHDEGEVLFTLKHGELQAFLISTDGLPVALEVNVALDMWRTLYEKTL